MRNHLRVTHFVQPDSCGLEPIKSYGHWETPRVLLPHWEAVFGLHVHTVIPLSKCS